MHVLQQVFPNWDTLRIMRSRHDHLDWMHRHFAETVVTGSELLAEVAATAPVSGPTSGQRHRGAPWRAHPWDGDRAKLELRNFVGGEHVDAADGRRMDLVDPATGEVFASGAGLGAEDVDRAYTAAAARSRAGGTRPRPSGRWRCSAFADAVEEHADELVALESRNTGKPLGLTTSEEIPPMVDQIRFFAGAARNLEGKAAAEYMAGHTSWIRREPIGVVGQVTPWNYPMMMAVWKFAPAIAAGNTVVLKPSDTTPATTLRLAELAAEFLPPGVFNVVCGDRDTGRALVEHRTPQMVSITGSVRAGMQVAEAASRDVKRVHLELGGKAPVVVFDDADLEAAAEAIAVAGYFNAGQDCTAATRVLAGPGIHDDFVAALTEQARSTTDDVRERRRRRGRPGAPGEQRQPAGPRHRLPRPRARPRRGHRRRAPAGRPGLLRRADRRRRAAAGRRDGPARDLRPGHHRAAVHRRGRGAGAGPTASSTAWPPASGRRTSAGRCG